MTYIITTYTNEITELLAPNALEALTLFRQNSGASVVSVRPKLVVLH